MAQRFAEMATSNLRYFQIKDKEGDGYCKDSITKRLEAAGFHAISLPELGDCVGELPVPILEAQGFGWIDALTSIQPFLPT